MLLCLRGIYLQHETSDIAAHPAQDPNSQVNSSKMIILTFSPLWVKTHLVIIVSKLY